MKSLTTNGVEGPKGIGGWLIVFAISLGVAPIVLLVALIRNIDLVRQATPAFRPDHPYYSPWWAPLWSGEILFTLTWLVASCWLLVLFFAKKAKFPRSWVRVNIVLTVFATLDAIAVSLMWQKFPDLWTREEIIGMFRFLLKVWIGIWIWSRYLIKSRRVRNTFVQ